MERMNFYVHDHSQLKNILAAIPVQVHARLPDANEWPQRFVKIPKEEPAEGTPTPESMEDANVLTFMKQEVDIFGTPVKVWVRCEIRDAVPGAKMKKLKKGKRK